MYVEALYNVKSLQQPHITIALRGTVALRHRRVCVRWLEARRADAKNKANVA